MFNDYLASELARMRREERLEEVDLSRALREARRIKPSLADRLMLKGGEMLINIGQRLKARYELSMEARHAL